MPGAIDLTGLFGKVGLTTQTMDGEWVKTTTPPSKPLNILDVPPPLEIITKFLYIKFKPDETTNDTGVLMEGFNLSHGDTPIIPHFADPSGLGEGILPISEFIFHVPRLVRIDIKPIQILSHDAPLDDTVELTLEEGENYERFIRDHTGDLVDESYFSAAGYSNIPFSSFYLQDNNLSITAKETLYLAASISKEASGFGSGNEQEHLEKFTELLTAGDSSDGTAGVQTFLQDIMAGNAADNINVFSAEGNFLHTSMPFDRVVHYGQLNCRYAGSIVARMSSDAMGPFANTICDDLSFVTTLQTAARLGASSSQMALAEFNLVFPFLDQARFKTFNSKITSYGDQFPTDMGMYTANSAWEIKLIGYLIEKFELVDLEEGGTVWLRKENIVFGQPFQSAGIDTKIKIGATYLYRPRSVAVVGLPIWDTAINAYTFINVLVVSQPGPSSILTTDKKPGLVIGTDTRPPEPRDLKFIWDYYNDTLLMSWAHPVNFQEDTKYFKIYRRSSLYEPYQLLALYDFNNTYTAKFLAFYDWIRPSLIKVFPTGRPKTHFIDNDFTKDSVFIYSVVAGDASGQWSNYSTQFVVSFDRFRNKLNVEYLSPPGAPEPYPNWFVREDLKSLPGRTDLTADSIKVSNYEKMSIILDPDARIIYRDDHLIGSGPGLGGGGKGGYIGDADPKEPGPQTELKQGQKTVSHIITAKNETTAPYSTGRYIMTMTNLDHQKSHKIDINIKVV